jgi:hypothetical protein
MSGCMSVASKRKSAVRVHLRSMAADREKRPRGVENERDVT